MRKNFDEAKRKATKENKPKKQWGQVTVNLYGVVHEMHFLLVPLAIAISTYDHLNNKYYTSLAWDETKATKLLDKRLGKILEYVPEDDAYYFCMGWSSSYLMDKAPFGMRTWARKYYFEVKNFIKDGYTNPHYTKTVEKDEYHDEWVKFEPVRYINGKKDNQVVTGERQAEMDKNIPKF